MLTFPSTCFAGRIIFNRGGLDQTLEWDRPCPVPPECVVPLEPPLYFCVGHYDAVMDHLYGQFERQGLINESIVAEPMDEFDAMMQRLRDEGR